MDESREAPHLVAELALPGRLVLYQDYVPSSETFVLRAVRRQRAADERRVRNGARYRCGVAADHAKPRRPRRAGSGITEHDIAGQHTADGKFGANRAPRRGAARARW